MLAMWQPHFVLQRVLQFRSVHAVYELEALAQRAVHRFMPKWFLCQWHRHDPSHLLAGVVAQRGGDQALAVPLAPAGFETVPKLTPNVCVPTAHKLIPISS